MIYIRSLAYLVFLALSVVIVCGPILVLGGLNLQGAIGWIAHQWGTWNLGALRVLCGLNVRFRGAENLPSEAVIVLCKHQSAWETLALRKFLPPQQTWVLKRELMWVPFFGWALAPYRPIAIDRKAGRQAIKQLLDQGKRWLAAGRWIVIFPEGTRVAPGERAPYAIGGAMLAERTGRPILPIAHNAGVFWPRRSIVKFPGVVDLVIGPLIPTAGRKAQEINAEVERWIEDTVASLPGAREVPIERQAIRRKAFSFCKRSDV
jgi:1-acyl-sn-glycerol-3-phosphate acyltransferase